MRTVIKDVDLGFVFTQGRQTWAPVRLGQVGVSPCNAKRDEAKRAIIVEKDGERALVRSEVAEFLGFESGLLRRVSLTPCFGTLAGNWYVLDKYGMDMLLEKADYPSRNDVERAVKARREAAYIWFAEQGVAI